MRPGRSDDKGRRVTARRTKGDDGPRPILATDERKPIASDVNTGKAETASRPSPRKREEVPRPPSTAETTRAGCNSARALTRFTRRKRNGSVQADGWSGKRAARDATHEVRSKRRQGTTSYH